MYQLLKVQAIALVVIKFFERLHDYCTRPSLLVRLQQSAHQIGVQAADGGLCRGALACGALYLFTALLRASGTTNALGAPVFMFPDHLALVQILCTTFGLCNEAARPRCHSFNSPVGRVEGGPWAFLVMYVQKLGRVVPSCKYRWLYRWTHITHLDLLIATGLAEFSETSLAPGETYPSAAAVQGEGLEDCHPRASGWRYPVFFAAGFSCDEQERQDVTGTVVELDQRQVNDRTALWG